jgi:hypothetical protein
MIPVYCIDDAGTKYKAYGDLATALKGLDCVQFLGLPDESCQRAIDPWGCAAEASVQPASMFAACTGESRSVILLDISGVHTAKRLRALTHMATEKVDQDPLRSMGWRELVAALPERKKHPRYARAFEKHGVPFFICTAARIFGHRVILFSTGATVADVDAFEHEFRLSRIPERGPRAKEILEQALLELNKPVDRQYLQAYLEHVREAGIQDSATHASDSGAWDHDDFKNATLRALWSRRLGVTGDVDEDTLKPFLHLPREQRAAPVAKLADSYIPARTLRDVIEAMRFPCSVVEVSGAEHDAGQESFFKLPMRPGLLFLLGLWRVVKGMKDLKERGYGRSSCRLRFDALRGGPDNRGWVYRARLTLPGTAPVDHIFRYQKKTTDGALTGWCREMEDVAWGRLSLEGLSDDLTKLPVAKLLEAGFQRPGAPPSPTRVASLSLGPGEIAYYWI